MSFDCVCVGGAKLLERIMKAEGEIEVIALNATKQNSIQLSFIPKKTIQTSIC